MLKQMTACGCMHQCRFPYLYGLCEISFPICLANYLPASTGIDIGLCSGNVWAREVGPNCGRAVGPHRAKETGPGWATEVGPVCGREVGRGCGREVGPGCAKETGPGWAW